METAINFRKNMERTEAEYDKLITRLNELQGALSGKSTMVNELGPGEYRLWLAKAKSAVQRVQADIAVKKVERSEARRAFNGWEPADDLPEEWLDKPDSDGWWWFYGTTYDTDDAEIEATMPIEIVLNACGELFVEGDPLNDGDSFDLYRGKWKFLPLPDLP